MQRHWLFSAAILAATLSASLSGCSRDESLSAALVGKWSNVDQGQDTFEFRADGSLRIAGQRKRDAIAGEYRFLDDANVEMRFRFPEGNPWRPRWMPPGMNRDPMMRAYVRFAGDVLELRPRAHIQSGNIDQFIEFGVLRFDRIVEEPPE